MTSTDLGNHCLKTCSWIPLTMVKSLLLNSALLEIRVPAQILCVHMQVQYWTKFGIHLQCAKSTYNCGFRRKLAIFACCGIRNKLNVPTKFALQIVEQIAQIYSLTSGFARLIMKTKAVCHGLSGLYVNFMTMKQCEQ